MNERKLIDFCKELRREFETQDTDGQAHPRYWAKSKGCWANDQK